MQQESNISNLNLALHLYKRLSADEKKLFTVVTEDLQCKKADSKIAKKRKEKAEEDRFYNLLVADNVARFLND